MRDEFDFSNGNRGAVIPTSPGKVRVTIRLDREVLDWFRKRVDATGGGNYQTEINCALREHMAREPWAEEMRADTTGGA